MCRSVGVHMRPPETCVFAVLWFPLGGSFPSDGEGCYFKSISGEQLAEAE